MTYLRLFTVLAAGLLLSGCSTLSSVGETIGDLNPFDSSEADAKKAQGDVAGENERISILRLDDTLKVANAPAEGAIVLPAAYVNADWPQPGGSATHAVQHPAASGPLERVWTKNLGDGSGRKGRVLAPPVISGGKIIAMDADNTVRAVDIESGKELWRHKASVTRRGKTRTGKVGIVERVRDPLSFTDRGGHDKESVGGGVTSAGGVIYMTSGLGVVEALDANTGASIWRNQGRVPMHSAPTYGGGRVFAVTDDNELVAYNAANGEVLWTYQGIVESARMLTAPSPAVIDEVVIAPFASGEIVALRVQNGSVLWQDAMSSSGRLTPLATLNDIAAGPVIADGYVIASAQSGSMTAFDLRTGQRIWTQPAGTLGYPWVAGDVVFTVTTEGQVAALSKLDGSVLWITQLAQFKNAKKRKKRIAYAGPVLAGERLLVFGSNGIATQIEPYYGGIQREFKIGESVYVPPIVANETIYLLTDSAKVVALR